MISKLFITTLFFITFLGNSLFSQTMGDNSAVPQKVSISNTQTQKMTSKIVGQEYDLYINLPNDYGDTNKIFPVLYVLDAQWDFTLLNAIYGQQYYDGFLPSMVIVGVTWGGENPNPDSLRARDFTPTNEKRHPQSGNAAKFLSFIKNELIPFIESKYRVKKDDRTLMGSSLGGLFTLYTLFHETHLFNRYVLTSPALTWDNEVTFQYENDYAEKNADLPAKLFIGIGQYEDQTVFDKFVNTLKNRDYKSLDFTDMVLKNVGHSGGKSIGYTYGLQAVFARPSLQISPSILREYAGIYKSNSGTEFKISVQNGKLMVKRLGNSEEILKAKSESGFYIKGVFFNVNFEKDNNNKVTGFKLDEYTGRRFVKKINS
jgi:predicted alpha/beta superfamily hydrolase